MMMFQPSSRMSIGRPRNHNKDGGYMLGCLCFVSTFGTNYELTNELSTTASTSLLHWRTKTSAVPNTSK